MTGTVILIIGLSLMAVAAGWAGGGAGADNFGAPVNLVFAAFTLLVILALERFAPPALQRLSILLGLVIGTLVSIPFGLADFSGAAEQDWFGVSTPFHFGLPTFQISAIVAMSVVALVIMTETTGDMLAIGEIVDKPVEPRQLADGLRADGLSTVLGGVFNTFPYTAFAQNVGLVSLTGVKSRYVATFAGGVLVLLGLLPKLGGIVQGIPQGVLGGAGVALFGMVAASGVRTLSRVRFNNANVLVVAISLGVGLLPTVSPELYGQFPTWFQIIFNSGISAGALTAILLNLVLNSRSMQRRHGSDEGEFSAHDAVRAAAADTSMPVPDSAPLSTSTRPRRSAEPGGVKTTGEPHRLSPAVSYFLGQVHQGGWWGPGPRQPAGATRPSGPGTAQEASRCRRPLARRAGRCTARRTASSVPSTSTRSVARVTAV